MDMRNLVSAAENALDPVNSDRTDLINIYENSWKDSRVISEREKADSYLITEPYEVLSGGTPNKEKKKLFDRPWFFNFLKLAMHVEFWGHTLLEFQEQDENGEFSDVKVFPRRHVRPFEKMIVADPSYREGISYDGHETEFFLIELGEAEELGKLETVSREIIWKTFARADWSEYNERFGKPLLDFAVDTSDESEMKAKVEMAENFGTNGWLLRDIDDQVEIKVATTRAGCENFRDLAQFCDDQIAMLFNGQKGTSDEQAYVGAAEVHERILNTFTEARLLNVQNIINYKLIPFLRAHGYDLAEDDTVQFTTLNPENRKKKQETTPRQPDDPNDPHNRVPGFFA
jgi:hypothetical protein